MCPGHLKGLKALQILPPLLNAPCPPGLLHSLNPLMKPQCGAAACLGSWEPGADRPPVTGLGGGKGSNPASATLPCLSFSTCKQLGAQPSSVGLGVGN